MKHKLGDCHLYIRSMGKLLHVTAMFETEGEANWHMSKSGNNDAVVAVLPSGLILLADKGDRGLEVKS